MTWNRNNSTDMTIKVYSREIINFIRYVTWENCTNANDLVVDI